MRKSKALGIMLIAFIITGCAAEDNSAYEHKDNFVAKETPSSDYVDVTDIINSSTDVQMPELKDTVGNIMDYYVESKENSESNNTDVEENSTEMNTDTEEITEQASEVSEVTNDSRYSTIDLSMFSTDNSKSIMKDIMDAEGRTDFHMYGYFDSEDQYGTLRTYYITFDYNEVYFLYERENESYSLKSQYVTYEDTLLDFEDENSTEDNGGQSIDN